MNRLIVIFAVLSIVLGGCTSEYKFHSVPVAVEEPLVSKPDNPNSGTHYGTDNVNVDVLVVLDASGSMNDDDDILDSIPDIVIDLWDRPEISWRLGILTADPEEIELFTEIDLRDKDAVLQMEDAVGDLINSSPWQERPFDSIIEFYNEELWFREVFTIFVVITDEPEQSSMTVEEFENEWPTRFDFVAVAGNEEIFPDCHAHHAPKLIDISTKFINICDNESWSIF